MGQSEPWRAQLATWSSVVLGRSALRSEQESRGDGQGVLDGALGAFLAGQGDLGAPLLRQGAVGGDGDLGAVVSARGVCGGGVGQAAEREESGRGPGLRRSVLSLGRDGEGRSGVPRSASCARCAVDRAVGSMGRGGRVDWGGWWAEGDGLLMGRLAAMKLSL